jgi:hypothetical protein
VQGGFFLRKKPLDSVGFGVQQLENRYSRAANANQTNRALAPAFFDLRFQVRFQQVPRTPRRNLADGKKRSIAFLEDEYQDCPGAAFYGPLEFWPCNRAQLQSCHMKAQRAQA